MLLLFFNCKTSSERLVSTCNTAAELRKWYIKSHETAKLGEQLEGEKKNAGQLLLPQDDVSAALEAVKGGRADKGNIQPRGTSASNGISKKDSPLRSFASTDTDSHSNPRCLMGQMHGTLARSCRDNKMKIDEQGGKEKLEITSDQPLRRRSRHDKSYQLPRSWSGEESHWRHTGISNLPVDPPSG